jgi:hypothetical protein
MKSYNINLIYILILISIHNAHAQNLEINENFDTGNSLIQTSYYVKKHMEFERVINPDTLKTKTKAKVKDMVAALDLKGMIRHPFLQLHKNYSIKPEQFFQTYTCQIDYYVPSTTSVTDGQISIVVKWNDGDPNKGKGLWLAKVDLSTVIYDSWETLRILDNVVVPDTDKEGNTITNLQVYVYIIDNQPHAVEGTTDIYFDNFNFEIMED